MTYRLVSVLLNIQAFNKELKTIKYIFKSNNVYLDTEKAVRKKLMTRILDTTTYQPRIEKKKNGFVCRTLALFLAVSPVFQEYPISAPHAIQ
jgi:hypothetical protein